MDFTQFIISLGSGIIIILIGIVSYFVKKDFNRIEKELKDKRDNESCELIHQTNDERIIRKINELNVKLTNKFFPGLGTEGSPYHPNKIGKKILRESGWNKIYQDIKGEIFSWIDQEKPKSLYDVEKIAFYVLDKNKDNQNFFPLKEYIINNPKTDISAVFMVASWIIRDEYWQSRNKESNNLK